MMKRSALGVWRCVGAFSPGRIACSPAYRVGVMKVVPGSMGFSSISTRRSACLAVISSQARMRRGRVSCQRQIEHVVVQIAVARERPPGALENVMIGGVEAHQRREKAPVGLGQRVTDQVALVRQALLERVQPREHLFHGLVVGCLSRRETGPVY